MGIDFVHQVEDRLSEARVEDEGNQWMVLTNCVCSKGR
jgi:hypothetical protein